MEEGHGEVAVRNDLAAVAMVALAGLAAPLHAEGLLATHKIPAAWPARQRPRRWPPAPSRIYAETAVVVDADGVRIALLRGDGAGAHTLDSAFYKAYTAASFKADSTAVAARAQGNPSLANLLGKLPNTVQAGGGLVIKSGNETIGGSAPPARRASSSTTIARVPASTRSGTG